MSDIIDFLERVGQDSNLRHASRAQLERAASEVHMSPEVRAALADRDQHLLATLLGTGNVCCLINVPVGGDDEQADDKRRAPASRVA